MTLMTRPVERLFESRESMIQSITLNSKNLLRRSIIESDQATLFVSGGSTPKPFYQALSRSNIDWNKTSIAMVDERWVSSTSEASNENFIRKNLLQNFATKAKFISMKTESETATQAQSEVNYRYKHLKPIDLMILGMGNDGHTASLFPHSEGLSTALNHKAPLCSAIKAKQSEITGNYLERMSITLNTVHHTKLIFLMLTGKEKLKVYRQALAGSDIDEMPIRAFLSQTKTPIIVYWAA